MASMTVPTFIFAIFALSVASVTASSDSDNNSKLLHYTNLFEGGASPDEKLMMDWLYEHKFVDAGASKQVDMGPAGRGMVYTRDVKRGEELFTIPADLMLFTSNRHLHPTTKRVLRLFAEHFRLPGKIAPDFELTEIALVVMFERRNPESFFRHYLGPLQFPLCPAFFTEDKMSQFEYSWLNDWKGYFLSDAVQNFARLMKLPQFELMRSKDLEKEFMWAASTALQRSFDWGPDARREYVMVPYLDMINHRANVSNNYYYSSGYLRIRKPTGNVVRQPIERGMVLAADDDHVKGSPVEISYSLSSSNIQMLLQYGFVVANNPHDYLVIQLKAPADRPDFVEVIKSLGGVLASVPADGEIPLAFVKATSLVATGKPTVSIESYQLIRAAVQSDLDSFSTTLKEDMALMKTDLSRGDFSIVAYRVEAKKLLLRVLSRIDVHIAALRAGSKVDVPVTNTRKDWPLRHIVVQVDGGKGAKDAAKGSKNTAATTEQGKKKEEL